MLSIRSLRVLKRDTTSCLVLVCFLHVVCELSCVEAAILVRVGSIKGSLVLFYAVFHGCKLIVHFSLILSAEGLVPGKLSLGGEAGEGESGLVGGRSNVFHLIIIYL